MLSQYFFLYLPSLNVEVGNVYRDQAETKVTCNINFVAKEPILIVIVWREFIAKVIITYFQDKAKFWQPQISRQLQSRNNHDTTVDKAGQRLISTTNKAVCPMIRYMQEMWCSSVKNNEVLSTINLLRPNDIYMRVGTLIAATIYLQLIQNRYMFQSFTVLQCSHQHCVQPVASEVEVVGYL